MKAALGEEEVEIGVLVGERAVDLEAGEEADLEVRLASGPKVAKEGSRAA